MKENKTAAVIALNAIILLLGAVLLTQFFSFLFSPTSWEAYLLALQPSVSANVLSHAILNLLQNTAPLSYFLFMIGTFISALAALALFARFYTCLFIGLGFFIVWILQWRATGVWPYQFLFPACFAILAGLASRKLSLKPQAFFSQLGFSFFQKFLSIGLLSAFLYYVTTLAFNEAHYAERVGLWSGAAFFVLCFAFNGLKKQTSERDEQGLIQNYLDYMALVIGSMLVMQVYANYFSGLFELKDFKDSLVYYAHASNAHWLQGFLLFAAEYSAFILPFYIVFEVSLALSLSLLLLRAPVLFITGGLLGTLAFAELGVSSDWPPNPKYLTWQWELLLATLVAFILGTVKMRPLFQNFSLRYLLLGGPLARPPLSLFSIIIIALIAGLSLYGIGLVTQVFGSSYPDTALFSGLSFAVLVFILLLSDKIRRP